MMNGELIDLQAGDYQARIATSGACLMHLRHEGRDLVVPCDAERNLPTGWQGKTLVPWPNRIKDSAYSYAGQRYLVPCNEPETGSALHGMVGWADFEVRALLDGNGQEIENEENTLTPAGVILGLLMPATYFYPWSLDVEVTYQLSATHGLTSSITSTNLGAAAPVGITAGAPLIEGELAPAPYGVSCHPYLTRSVPLDECTLTAPASQILEVDPATMAPTHLDSVEGTERDWRTGRRVGATTTDHAYTGLPEGEWQVRLAGGPTAHTVVMSAVAPWVQLFSGENMERAGVAVEPMTCPPNAFNSGEDLLTLAVGESHTFTYRIHEEE